MNAQKCETFLVHRAQPNNIQNKLSAYTWKEKGRRNHRLCGTVLYRTSVWKLTKTISSFSARQTSKTFCVVPKNIIFFYKIFCSSLLPCSFRAQLSHLLIFSFRRAVFLLPVFYGLELCQQLSFENSVPVSTPELFLIYPKIRTQKYFHNESGIRTTFQLLKLELFGKFNENVCEKVISN